MTAILVPPSSPFSSTLTFLASYLQLSISLTEDESVSAPSATFKNSPAIGLLAVATGLIRESKEAKEAKELLGDGNASLSASISAFASIADSFFSGTPDPKPALTELQSALSLHSYLVNDTLTVADLLLYPALNSHILALSEPEKAKDFVDVVRWALQIQSLAAPVLPQIPVPVSHPWISLERSAKPAAAPARVAADKPPPKSAAKKAAPPPKDPFSLIDVRVAQIVKVWPHPNADSLYCEEIDIGGTIRKVVTGVRNFVPIEEMQGRRCLVFVNIKPGKIRGEPSESMVFAASTQAHDRVELLDPPVGTPIGTRVKCGDLVGDEVPPVDKNGKVWKAVSEGGSLTINGDRIACYKGIPLTVPEGPITVATLTDCEFH